MQKSDVINRINNGSATMEDYAEFFKMFNVPITNADGSYRPLYDIFVEAGHNFANGNINYKAINVCDHWGGESLNEFK